jgi:fructosamine-3-kinase
MIPAEISASLTDYFSASPGIDFSLLSARSLSGGCINNVSRLDTSAGVFCLKYNVADSFPGMFEAEAKGLTLLSESGEIRVPRVICTGTSGKYSYILLEFIDSGRRKPGFMEDFGKRLARLHKHTDRYFGLDHDNYMGSLRQSNRLYRGWISFFREERIEPQLKIAKEGGYFSKNELAAFPRLYTKLIDIIPAYPPSLIHGDLWSGNYMVDETGDPCLIDPAVNYGHREAEIAMTTLFGGFDASFYDAYQQEFPMEPGWRERLDIYNLYPLLIHLNLFGSGYLGGILDVLRRYSNF